MIKEGEDRMNIVGVVGSGSMGIGIVQLLLARGYEVVFYSRRESSIKNGVKVLEKSLDRLVQKT